MNIIQSCTAGFWNQSASRLTRLFPLRSRLAPPVSCREASARAPKVCSGHDYRIRRDAQDKPFPGGEPGHGHRLGYRFLGLCLWYVGMWFISYCFCQCVMYASVTKVYIFHRVTYASVCKYAIFCYRVAHASVCEVYVFHPICMRDVTCMKS